MGVLSSQSIWRTEAICDWLHTIVSVIIRSILVYKIIKINLAYCGEGGICNYSAILTSLYLSQRGIKGAAFPRLTRFSVIKNTPPSTLPEYSLVSKYSSFSQASIA